MNGPGGLSTPDEWCEHYRVEVRDPDGWRKPDSPPWDRPIGLAEFWARLAASTARQLDLGAYGRIQHDLRVLAHRQPDPVPNYRPHVADLVINDIRARKAHGLAEYGTPLQPFNGRDALRDLYEELLDGAHYLAQEMWERAHSVDLSQFDTLAYGHSSEERWVAVIHKPCGRFVFGGDEDDPDGVPVAELLRRANAHSCDPADLEAARV